MPPPERATLWPAADIWPRFEEALTSRGWTRTDEVVVSDIDPSFNAAGGFIEQRVRWRIGPLTCDVSLGSHPETGALIWWSFRAGDRPVAGETAKPRGMLAFLAFLSDLDATNELTGVGRSSASLEAGQPTALGPSEHAETAAFWGALRMVLSQHGWVLAQAGEPDHEEWSYAVRTGSAPLLFTCQVASHASSRGLPVFLCSVLLQRSPDDDPIPAARVEIRNFTPEAVAEFGQILEKLIPPKQRNQLGSHAGGDREPTQLERPDPQKWSWERLIIDPMARKKLRQLQRVIEDPSRTAKLGADPLRGALLAGPPGCGKTTIARILAAQSKAAFYAVKSSELLGSMNGETEKALDRLFNEATRNAPAIVFIDEIDGLAPKRGSALNPGWKDQQTNALLVELDGLDRRPGVFVLGATNRPDILDEALLRGGRLGMRLDVELPKTDEARTGFLQLFTRSMPLASDVDLSALARASGERELSPADLEGLCQHAALDALARDENAEVVTAADFAEALHDAAKEKRKAPTGFRMPAPASAGAALLTERS